MSRFARKMRRHDMLRCKGCGGLLYPNENPFTDDKYFCNDSSCPESNGGKPLPPEMLPKPARRYAAAEHARR